MLTPFYLMLLKAKAENYAVGAFNIYNMEGALAVVQAAEELNSPVLLQVLPAALEIGGVALTRMCLTLAKSAAVPVAVHLDHCSNPGQIETALSMGITSVMADGSESDFQTNVTFTRKMAALADRFNAGVEAELGRIGGIEDGQTLSDLEPQMTRPSQAVDFVTKTRVSALAVCIGNVHGKYPTTPELDFHRLEKISGLVQVPLVLHGTSGLPDSMITRAIECGVTKFNVNTEVRSAYLDRMGTAFESGTKPELVEIMQSSINAMKEVVKEKITTFKSAGRAD